LDPSLSCPVDQPEYRGPQRYHNQIRFDRTRTPGRRLAPAKSESMKPKHPHQTAKPRSVAFDVWPNATPVKLAAPRAAVESAAISGDLKTAHSALITAPRPTPAPAAKPAASPHAHRLFESGNLIPGAASARSLSNIGDNDRRTAAALIADGEISVAGQSHVVRRIGILAGLVFWRCGCGLTLARALDDQSDRLWWIQTRGFIPLDSAPALIRALRTGCWQQRSALARAARASRETDTSASGKS